MNKVFAGLLAAALLGLLGVGLLAKRQNTELARIRGENTTLREGLQRAAEQRKTDAAVLARRARENAATARELASARASLAGALAQSREWAEQPVPASVREALEAGK